MTKPFVSVMLPSRKRPSRLIESIRSVYDNAEDPRKIETLIKIDTDDVESYNSAVTDEINLITKGNYKLLISSRLEGYWSLHHAWNDLAAISQGEFLVLWNDDALITSPKWDLILEDYKNMICIIQFFSPQLNSVWPVFPITHRKIYETLGYLSHSAFNDSYLHDLAALAGVEYFEPRLHSVHNRSDMTSVEKDSTFIEGAEESITGSPNWKKEWDKYNVEQFEKTKENALKIAYLVGNKYSVEYEKTMKTRHEYFNKAKGK